MISKPQQKTLVILLFIVAIVAAFVISLPKPIDIDLTNIGNGKKSVVFVYDLNRVVSNQQAMQINAAQEKLGDTVNFLIARTGYPETDEFIERYSADIAELLFFDENGQIYDRQYALLSSEALILNLSER